MSAQQGLASSRLSLCQEADDSIVRAQQEVAFGGQQGQAGECATEVLRAELGGGLGGRLQQGADANLVGHGSGDHLAAIQVEGVNRVGRRLVVVCGLLFQLLPDGQRVVRGGADQDAALHRLLRERRASAGPGPSRCPPSLRVFPFPPRKTGHPEQWTSYHPLTLC